MNTVRKTINDRYAEQLGYNKTENTVHLKSGVKKSKLLDQIIKQSQVRTRKDIDSWRKAIQRAESALSPKQDLLQQLYQDVVIDTHISGLIEHSRIGALLSEEWQIVDESSGEREDDITKILRSAWFTRFIRLAMDSLWYRVSVMEFDMIVANEKVTGIDLIPRANIEPVKGHLLRRLTDDTGIPYRDEPMIIEVLQEDNLGLLMKAAPWFIYKKNAAMAWSEFTEIFGMPMRVGKTNSRDQKDLDRMEQHLQNMGSAAYAIFQEGEEIELKDITRTDSYNVYDKMIDRCNSELSKLFLGNTMTTDVGKNGSRAQAEVHERVSDKVLESDKRFISSVVNDQLFPMLMQYGWKLENKKFEYPETKGIDQLWSRTLATMPHYEVDEDWFRDSFGVQITEKKQNQDPPEKSKLRKEVDELYREYFK